MRRVPVESSVIAEIGYEDEVMEVRFNNEIRGEYLCKRIRSGHSILRWS